MADDAANDANEQDGKKKSGGGFMSIASLGLAAGIGAFMANFLAPQNAASSEICVASNITTQEKPAFEAPEAFVALPEILITVGSTPATRYLKMNVSIATSSAGASKVKKSEPVLIDAFNNYLRSVELSDMEDPGFYAHMREQLSHRAEIILGPDKTSGVLITEFLLR